MAFPPLHWKSRFFGKGMSETVFVFIAACQPRTNAFLAFTLNVSLLHTELRDGFTDPSIHWLIAWLIDVYCVCVSVSPVGISVFTGSRPASAPLELELRSVVSACEW